MKYYFKYNKIILIYLRKMIKFINYQISVWIAIKKIL